MVVVLWQHYLAFQYASVAALLGLPVCFCGSTTWPSSMLLWQHYLAFQYASVAALLGLPVCFCGRLVNPVCFCGSTSSSSMLLWQIEIMVPVCFCGKFSSMIICMQHYLAFQYASVAALLGLIFFDTFQAYYVILLWQHYLGLVDIVSMLLWQHYLAFQYASVTCKSNKLCCRLHPEGF